MKKIIVIGIAVVGVLFSYGASYVAALTTCNESYYLQTYPDIAAAVASGEFSSGCEHYSLFGKDEGRSALAPCDEDTYLQTYPDVAEAVSDGRFSSGCEHYYLYGQDEERRPGPPCDEPWYLQTYSDVEAAVDGGDYSSGCKHYYVYGKDEGRSPGDTCDEAYYLSIYPDVSEAVSNGVYSSGCAHYFLYGREEGRVAENPDADGDGLTENQGDCDDTDASINLSATEICGDGIDQDCDGTDEACDTGGGDSGGGDSGGGDSGGGDSGGGGTVADLCCECTYICENNTVYTATQVGGSDDCEGRCGRASDDACGREGVVSFFYSPADCN